MERAFSSGAKTMAKSPRHGDEDQRTRDGSMHNFGHADTRAGTGAKNGRIDSL